ncbi:unnamed protein product [Arabis nemorensis]|uniref:Uncharacterized protein n=1 Tax=Arabis nemorensis TaxID=586526 RepID=A0A565B340_9BRAS|nr:unnamed protein product [Arabis nemorensis]
MQLAASPPQATCSLALRLGERQETPREVTFTSEPKYAEMMDPDVSKENNRSRGRGRGRGRGQGGGRKTIPRSPLQGAST